MPIRGFESSMDPRPNIGLGKIDTVERIVVEWPDGNGELLLDVPTNQTLILEQKKGVPLDNIKLYQPEVINVDPTFTPVKDVADFLHSENDFVDFDRDPLIYHMLSTEGPRMTTGDVNRDGRVDFYIGGAKDQPGALFIQTGNGVFKRTNEKLFEKDQAAEDMASTFFDADGDGDVDLYVCSGGNEFSNVSTALIDRLYINDGNGNFSKSSQVLPTSRFESTSSVNAADYDGDGDQDLFVGVRLLAFSYGAPMNGYILNNDGNGNFRNVTAEIAPELTNMGMITDGVWADIDGDKDHDLLIIGEYMPIKIFINVDGKLMDRTLEAGLSKSNGWWNRLEGSDLDHDGDIDFVIGNHGLNSRFRASVDQPVCMYVNDFDQNGTVEQIICAYNGAKSYPMALRHDLVKQIPSLKKKYLKYENYKDQTITDIFLPELVGQSVKLDAYEFSTSILINQGQGKFSLRPLPVEAQVSPVYGIEIADLDGDEHQDILLGGNLYRAKPEVGRYDASYAVFLKGDGKGNFTSVSSKDSGIKMDGEVRDIVYLQTEQGDLILAARNNDSILAFKKKEK
jgi:hypothetical protein